VSVWRNSLTVLKCYCALIVFSIKGLFALHEEKNRFKKRKDGWRKSPAEDQVQQARYPLPQVKTMHPKPAKEKCEHRSCSLVFHRDIYAVSLSEYHVCK